MRRKKGSGPIMDARRMAAGLANPRSGLRTASPFGYYPSGAQATTSLSMRHGAGTRAGGCPAGYVYGRDSVGNWTCVPRWSAVPPGSLPGPVLPPRTPDWPTLLAHNPGYMPWSPGWGAPAQSYDLGPGALGGTGVEVGPGPGSQVYFPGPYTPEQAATVGASYIASRGGMPYRR